MADGRVLSEEEVADYSSLVTRHSLSKEKIRNLIVTIHERDKTIAGLQGLHVDHECKQCGFVGSAPLSARCPQCHTVNDVWADGGTHPLHEENKLMRETLEWYGAQSTYEYIKDESAPILEDRGERARVALVKTGGDVTCSTAPKS